MKVKYLTHIPLSYALINYDQLSQETIDGVFEVFYKEGYEECFHVVLYRKQLYYASRLEEVRETLSESTWRNRLFRRMEDTPYYKFAETVYHVNKGISITP